MAMHRSLLALVVTLAPLGAGFATGACAGRSEVSAAATKPMSPAEGAADYKDSPGGPHMKPVIPSPSGEPSAGPAEVANCPPKCNADGTWYGCGLKKPRGSACQGCTPTCKAKGTADEGWYDCSGVLIAQRKCGSNSP